MTMHQILLRHNIIHWRSTVHMTIQIKSDPSFSWTNIVKRIKRKKNPQSLSQQHLVSALIGEVQLCLLRTEVNPRPLGHHLQVNGFVWLHPHNQLVPLTATSEYVSWNISELQTYFCLLLIQSFTAAEDERNSWFSCGWWNDRHELRKSLVMSLNVNKCGREERSDNVYHPIFHSGHRAL